MHFDSVETRSEISTPSREDLISDSLDVNLELLQSISIAIMEARTVETVLRMIVTGLVENARFPLARIWLIRPDEIRPTDASSAEHPEHLAWLHLAASAGHSQIDPKDWCSVRGGFPPLPSTWVAETGESVLVDVSATQTAWTLHPDWVLKEGIRAFACHPLIFGGEVLGVLAIFARAYIDKQQFQWLRVFADQAAVSINNARALEEIKELKDRLANENVALKEEIDQTSMFEEIVGSSEVLKRVLNQVRKVAPTDSTTLILGETGTGKELIARAIHRQSHRRGRAFIRVNCAAIPDSLLASELFGHERGAFTGATQRRLGRFELADGGTIFLDEVGELPSDTQVALLRVLQEREFERVGGAQSVRVNVRVIAATNRDLKAATAAGAFRLDLFYRLNVFPIEVPPLRERRDDIRLLLEYFIKRYSDQMGKKIRSVSKRTLDLFLAYDWRGNIRELQNVVERSVILSSGDALYVDESWFSTESSTNASESQFQPDDDENAEERKIIEAALIESRGRIAGPTGAASRLQVPRSTLESRIKMLKIRKSQFKFTAAASQ